MKALVIGGGIGGFVTALTLHAQGIECEVFEQAPAIDELGVGLNVLPQAVRVLTNLGLLDELDSVGVRTAELVYANRFGQTLWYEPRGLDAGHDYPQFSIHRGRLQGLLYRAALARIGAQAIHVDHQLRSLFQDASGVTATFIQSDGTERLARGDLLIAADGIQSSVRQFLYPHEGPPCWNGVMVWRGAIPSAPLLTGHSMLVCGGMDAKLVLYPIAPTTDVPGTNLLNWAITRRISNGSLPLPHRADWNYHVHHEDLAPEIARIFELPTIDLLDMIQMTETIYEFPMCDRDPLPQWSFGRVTLLGDAAHPMYPVGSNGATQAILDAECIAEELGSTNDVVTALRSYESIRLFATAQIVHSNRLGGPERIIDIVEERAPYGFHDLEEVISEQEIESIVKNYAVISTPQR